MGTPPLPQPAGFARISFHMEIPGHIIYVIQPGELCFQDATCVVLGHLPYLHFCGDDKTK